MSEPQFSITTHNGSVATSKAAKPVAMYTLSPRHAAISTEQQQSADEESPATLREAGRSCSPLNTAQVKRMAPAIVNRVPAIRNGGSVSIARRIAR